MGWHMACAVERDGSDPSFDAFMAISEALTGFTAYTLHGTGQTAAYWEIVRKGCGDAVAGIAARLSSRVSDTTVMAVMADAALGGAARSIIALWFTGGWVAPSAWGQPTSPNAVPVSGASYLEGLLWPVVCGHPEGGKHPGYDAWSRPPDGA